MHEVLGLEVWVLRQRSLCAGEGVAGSASSLSSSSTAPQSPTTPRPGPFEVYCHFLNRSYDIWVLSVCLTLRLCSNLRLVGMSLSAWGCAGHL